MLAFSYFLGKKKVLRRKKDIPLAKSLIEDANARIVFAKKSKEDTKYAFEASYESVRELMDAILAVVGYKSYSHEASIAYLQEYDFSQPVISHIDNIRKKRNNSKYYGKTIDKAEAESDMFFLESQFDILLVLVSGLIETEDKRHKL